MMIAFPVAIAIQFVYLTTGGGLLYGSRAIGTFNDPNQLGYWTLLAVACYAVIKGDKGGNLLDLVLLPVGMYIVYTGLSRAATIAMLVLVALVVWQTPWQARGRVIGAAALLLAGSAVVSMTSSDTLQGSAKRLMNVNVGEVEERGYARISQYPQYLVLGAGEGAYVRFHERGIEIHSTLGNVVFSYGVVGLALFTAVLVVIFRRATWAHRLYFVPIMLYGVGQMGLRFAYFWIFLGLVYGAARYGRRTHDEAPAAVTHGMRRSRRSSYRRRRSRLRPTEESAV
jgi:hypothetical protein